MIDEMEGQVSLFDQDTWYGKTSQEPLVATREETSSQSSRKSSGSSRRQPPMCLCLTGGGIGANLGACTMNWEDGRLLGEYTMHSFGEQPNTLMEECLFEALPNGVSASRLSQILEDSAHQKFYLSAKACAGILNRAKKRGKELPEILKTALENQMGSYTCDG